MTYILLLGLALLVQSHFMQTRNEVTDMKNNAEDDPFFSLRDNLRDISEENNIYTAGNTKCRLDHKCGYHQGQSYSLCYTDDKNIWDYCCTGACANDEDSLTMNCPSRNINAYCGNPGSRSVSGRKCLSLHQCGTHGVGGVHIYEKYWCYVDEEKNWDHCCNPRNKCSDKGDGYGNWCHTGIALYYGWAYCTPE